MKKIFVVSFVFFVQTIYSQIEDVKLLSQQNRKFVGVIENNPFNITGINFNHKDTLLNKEIPFKITYYNHSVEVNRGNYNDAWNYFFYENNDLRIAGNFNYEIRERVGTWYYFSKKYYIEASYRPDKVKWLDTIRDPDYPSVILYIDTVSSFEIEYPAKLYERNTSKFVKAFSERQVKDEAIKEEEVKEIFRRLSLPRN